MEEFEGLRRMEEVGSWRRMEEFEGMRRKEEVGSWRRMEEVEGMRRVLEEAESTQEGLVDRCFPGGAQLLVEHSPATLKQYKRKSDMSHGRAPPKTFRTTYLI